MGEADSSRLNRVLSYPVGLFMIKIKIGLFLLLSKYSTKYARIREFATSGVWVWNFADFNYGNSSFLTENSFKFHIKTHCTYNFSHKSAFSASNAYNWDVIISRYLFYMKAGVFVNYKYYAYVVLGKDGF